ncbi:MAG: hypothetical protein F6K21_05655 [Symploca sp. SIO2D2]|nr:hypothetical protein [Symploca sp. SIO2D2]
MKSKTYIKDHTSRHAKSIANLLPKTLGFGLDDLRAALSGDKTKFLEIGEAARQGRITAEMMPLLEEAYKQIIEGTTAYNSGVSRILKQAGRGGIQIDKSIAAASLANQQYINGRRELKNEYSTARSMEQTRHQNVLEFAQLRAYIDQHLVGVDHQGRMIDQTHRPEIKQIAEDNKYEQALSKHLLQNGQSARPDLLPRRDYQEPASQPSLKSIVSRFKAAIGV